MKLVPGWPQYRGTFSRSVGGKSDAEDKISCRGKQTDCGLNQYRVVNLEVFTALLRIQVFWDVTFCHPVGVSCFLGS
jgi:hypothetical protein